MIEENDAVERLRVSALFKRIPIESTLPLFKAPSLKSLSLRLPFGLKWEESSEILRMFRMDQAGLKEFELNTSTDGGAFICKLLESISGNSALETFTYFAYDTLDGARLLQALCSTLVRSKSLRCVTLSGGIRFRECDVAVVLKSVKEGSRLRHMLMKTEDGPRRNAFVGNTRITFI